MARGDFSEAEMAMHMTIIEIAEVLAPMVLPGDGRERYALYADWAREFNADFDARTAAGRSPEQTYYEDLDAFARRRAAAYGFRMRELGLSAALHSASQVEAAMQSCVALYEAYAAADPRNEGEGSSVAWESLDIAHQWATKALPQDMRDSIDATCARENAAGAVPVQPVATKPPLDLPDFDHLGAVFTEGFADRSLTFFIDYGNVEHRTEPAGKRFNIFIGAASGGGQNFEFDNWLEVVELLTKHRSSER